MRQAAGDQHDAGRAERLGLVDGAAIVVARLDAMRGVCREHAAAAIARQFEPGIAHRPHRAIEADGCDLIAPGIDGADAVPRTGVDDLREIALLADRRRVQRQPAMIGGKIAHQRFDAARCEHRLHAPCREFGIGEQPGLVGQPEQFGQMQRRARALLSADHGEMILMAVEIGHEHDAGLVEPRRRLEDVARQRHRRPQHVVEAGLVAGRQPRQRVGRRRRDGIEDAEQRVRKALARRRRSVRHN